MQVQTKFGPNQTTLCIEFISAGVTLGVCGALLQTADAAFAAAAAASRRMSSNAASDGTVTFTPLALECNTFAANAAACAGVCNAFNKPKSSSPSLKFSNRIEL